MQLKTVDAAWVKGWRHEAERDERPSPVFLVGFPRSGTTLLDTMLMGHPDVEVLEEEPTLLEAAKRTAAVRASSDRQRRCRSAPRETNIFVLPRSQLRSTPGKLLVDKNPLSMNLAAADPPALSRTRGSSSRCATRATPCSAASLPTSNINDGMSNFLRLDTAAELYDLSFSYFEKVRDLFELPVAYRRLRKCRGRTRSGS